MKDFEFESGVVTYRINGKREVSFNPNDVEFLEKLFTAFGELDETQAKYQRQLEKGRGTKEIFAIARKLDEEMRSTIDGVFGEGFCPFPVINILCVLIRVFNTYKVRELRPPHVFDTFGIRTH